MVVVDGKPMMVTRQRPMGGVKLPAFPEQTRGQ